MRSAAWSKASARDSDRMPRPWSMRWPASAWRSSRSRQQHKPLKTSSRRSTSATSGTSAEPAELGLLDFSVGHLHSFTAELGALLAFMAGHEPAGGVDDAPPWNILVGVGQDVTHESRPLRIAGVFGDVAVGHDFSFAQRVDHVEDAPVALVHIATT